MLEKVSKTELVILRTFSGEVRPGPRNNQLTSVDDLDHHREPFIAVFTSGNSLFYKQNKANKQNMNIMFGKPAMPR